ncbi:MAG: hypothetical protein WD601_09770, partial [Pseudohongiellaceae bacterium]
MKHLCRKLYSRTLQTLVTLGLLCLFASPAASNKNPDLTRLTFIPKPMDSSRDRDSPPAVAISSPVDVSSGLQQSIARYESRLMATENTQGPYHQSVFEDSLTLGNLYKASGEH